MPIRLRQRKKLSAEALVRLWLVVGLIGLVVAFVCLDVLTDIGGRRG